MRDEWSGCPYCGAELPVQKGGILHRILSLLTGFGTSHDPEDHAGKRYRSEPSFAGDSSEFARTDFSADPGAGVVFEGDDEFLLEVEEVFTLSGRGNVVTGHVHGAPVRLGDEIVVKTSQGLTRKGVVEGIEMSDQPLEEAQPGDNVGLLLTGIKKKHLREGTILRKT